jgi:hypothetical protein
VSIPVLDWRSDVMGQWYADLGDGSRLHIQLIDAMYELWRAHPHEALGYYPSLAEAKAHAKTWVGDDDPEGSS